MAEAAKDYVKDIKWKENLQANVDRGKISDDFDFSKFDKEMEVHFDQFMKKHKEEFSEKTQKGTLQTLFNKWLDDELIKMDEFRDKEIEREIIWPTTFVLQNFQYAAELWIFQRQLNEQKDASHRTEIVSVNGNELKIQTYKDNRWDKVDKNKIAELFDKNFERRDDLLNLLKQWWIDNVKRFQRIVTWLNEDGSEDQSKWKNTLLWNFWVDGKFGWNTMKAFENYISNHEVANTPEDETQPEQQTQTWSGVQSETQDWEMVQAQVNVDWQAIPVQPTWAPQLNSQAIPWDGNIKENNNPNAVNTDPNAENSTPNSVNNTPYTESQDAWINYYNNFEQSELKTAENEKQAIQRLTTSSSYWIQRVFGRHGYDEASALVIKGYDAMRNKPERKNLHKLRKWLNACLKEDWTFDKDLLTKALQKDETALTWKNEKKLKYISQLVKDKEEGKLENQPYLKLILWVLDDYFVKWVKDVNWIMDLYNNELIWENDDLYETQRAVEKAGLLDEIKWQLNALESELGIDNTENLTDEYKWMIVSMANIQKLLWLNSKEFQAVFDKYTYEEENNDKKEKKSIFENNEQVKFACCLCDMNADWKIDLSDRNTKTWQELFNLILDAQIEWQDAMANILTYAVSYAEQNGHNNTLKPIKDYISTPFNKENAGKILDKIKDNPIIMQYLREMLKKTSAENARTIIMKRSVEKIQFEEEEKMFWEFMMNPDVDKAVSDNMDSVMQELKESLENNEELDEKQKKELLKNLKQNPESIKRSIKFAFAWYLSVQKAGWGLGGSVSLWEIFKSDWLNHFSIWAHWWWYQGALLWLSLGYWNRVSNKEKTFSWDFGWNLWLSYNNWLSLLALACTWPEWQWNHNKLGKTLDVRTAKYSGIHAIWLWFTNFASILGGVGWDISYRWDKLTGIEQISKDMSFKVFESLYKAYSSCEDKQKFIEKEVFIKQVEEQLKQDFSNTDEETYTKSANILYAWLSYYLQSNNGGDVTPAEMGKIFNNISQDFALNWKNTAIAALDGKVSVTWISAWVVWVGKWIIPIVSLTTTNYENLFAHDTLESKNRYEASLYSELWMELKWNLDEKDRIDQNTVNYLNEKLSIYFPRGDMPKIKLRSESGTNNTICLYIPKELCKYIDVSYNQNLNGHISNGIDEENKDYFVVPANMKIWLSTYIWWWTMRANLILWDNKKASWDTPLKFDSQIPNDGDPTNYEPGLERISLFDINKINEELIKFREGNKDFPIQSCERANGEQILFNTVDWVTLTGDKLERKWNKIWLKGEPSGNLKVIRNLNGTHSIAFESNDSKKLSIKYNVIRQFESKFDFQKKELDKLFENIEKWLSTMDNWKREYSDFMESAKDLNYNQAFNKLVAMLTLDSNPQFGDLNSYLKSTSLTDYDKMLVVDRFKAIFSYNPNLTTPWAINRQLEKRQDQFMRLNWYINDKFPLDNGKDYRERVRLQLNKQTKIERKPNPNLIGMTAFYRKDNHAQSYLLTELWGTNVLWGVTKEIEQWKLEATQNWLINNLEKNTTYEKELLRSIVKTLDSKFNVDTEEPEIIHKKLSWLLKWESVDIWWKNVTIKAKYVFYLLWECANESIWVEIEWVEGDSYSDSFTVGGDYSITRSAAWLYVRTQAADNQLWISANDHVRWISSSLWLWEPVPPEPPSGGWTWNIPPSGGWTWDIPPSPSGGWTWRIPKEGISSITTDNTVDIK